MKKYNKLMETAMIIILITYCFVLRIFLVLTMSLTNTQARLIKYNCYSVYIMLYIKIQRNSPKSFSFDRVSPPMFTFQYLLHILLYTINPFLSGLPPSSSLWLPLWYCFGDSTFYSSEMTYHICSLLLCYNEQSNEQSLLFYC